MKPKFNFMHILKINMDILGAFGALQSLNRKYFHPNIVVKIAKNRCKSAQTSTKCWSISLKFGPKNCLPHTKSDCIGFRITSDIPVVSYVSYVVQEGENTVTDGCIREMLIYSQLR